MRRPLLVLAAAIAVIGLFGGGLGWLLDPPRPPVGASRAERLYYAYCADCHGVDGRGSWRALLFLRRPGDLADADRMRGYTDEYLFTIIQQGGDVLGRPGMPAFRQLSDEDVAALVRFIRRLPAARAASELPLLLEPDDDDLVAALPHRHPDAVPRRQPDVVEQPRLGDDRHRLHRRHAENGDGLVPDHEQVGSRARDDLAADLVGGGADDAAPQPGRERDQERREDGDDASAARAAGGGTGTTVVPGTSRTRRTRAGGRHR
jgi:mono/diheme cytochrome c family protein